MTPEQLDGLLTLAVSIVQAVFWVDNLYRSGRLWRSYRDARSFRAFLIAILLASAAVLFVAGSFVLVAQPSLLDPVRFAGLIVRGMFLIVGFITFITWRPRFTGRR